MMGSAPPPGQQFTQSPFGAPAQPGTLGSIMQRPMGGMAGNPNARLGLGLGLGGAARANFRANPQAFMASRPGVAARFGADMSGRRGAGKQAIAQKYAGGGTPQTMQALAMTGARPGSPLAGILQRRLQLPGAMGGGMPGSTGTFGGPDTAPVGQRPMGPGAAPRPQLPGGDGTMYGGGSPFQLAPPQVSRGY